MLLAEFMVGRKQLLWSVVLPVKFDCGFLLSTYWKSGNCSGVDSLITGFWARLVDHIYQATGPELIP